jgi:hypothetical protein
MTEHFVLVNKVTLADIRGLEMEKRGVIAPGVTPKMDEEVKEAVAREATINKIQRIKQLEEDAVARIITQAKAK